ncbi:MAG TPA: CocE/NonD family hydrolase, partial [Solirubrobacteraceae bacterium]|nr:CocE/NonD family hydrolase [Solirubrobacteraceae bacterium]
MRAALVAALSLLLAPAVASAGPLGLADCASREGVHQCSGLVQTWDGVPLDTTVTLPREGATGLPLVVAIHGFGNSKHEYLDPASTAYTDNAYAWARAGYAVLTYTARGLWGSCGTPESRLASPAGCARGYLHLADVRYEGRDTQELAGRLVDEGVADPRRIGVTGDSYGGGQSLMLAALRDRVMLPDGTLVPWRSAGGTALRIAGAAVVIPWTDLVYAIAPNGSTLTYAIAPPDASTSPVGVEKASVAGAVFAAAQNAIGPGQPVGEPFVPGRPMGFVAPPGVDPEADVTAWVARASAGPPYTDPLARSIVDTLTRFHSPFHIDASTPPAPLFVASGFTDDLFPVDEVTRFFNRTRRDHPGVPLSLLLGDFGHQRAANKPADRQRLLESVHGWLDRHVRDARPAAARAGTRAI